MIIFLHILLGFLLTWIGIITALFWKYKVSENTDIDKLIQTNYRFLSRLKLKYHYSIHGKYLIKNSRVMPLYINNKVVIFDALVYSKYHYDTISPQFFYAVKTYQKEGFKVYIITNKERTYTLKLALSNVKLLILNSFTESLIMRYFGLLIK